MSDQPAHNHEPLALSIAGVTKRFGPLVANDAISLDLRRGEILALLGENGAGKTTLMSVLFGHYLADEGAILVADGNGSLTPLPPGSPKAALAAGIGMVHQHFTLADNLPVLDNITLGTESLWQFWKNDRAAVTRLKELQRTSGLHVDLNAKVGRLSVGERQRVEILKALYRGARILILDEPTAVLTPQESDALFATLKRLTAGGLSVIFISHKLNEVLAVADRVAVLRAGRKVAEIDAKSANRALLAETMVGSAVQPSVRRAHEPGATIIELKDVRAPDPRGRQALEHACLSIRAGEILGVAGVAGNGQSALAALFCGLVAPTEGSVSIEGEIVSRFSPRDLMQSGVGRIPEDRHHDGVVGTMKLWENLALEDIRSGECQQAGLLRQGALKDRARAAIKTFDVRGGGPETEARLLSGGNMQKVILARVLDREPRVILANQPTRGLDVGAVSFVHQRLLDARANGAAILLMSEDLDELLALSDRVGVMYRGTLSAIRPAEEMTVRRLGLLMAGQNADLGDAA